MPVSNLPSALKAQARGFHIFPVARNAKVPHPAAGQWGMTATNDINQIIHFWTKVDPHANIGVACKPSQLLVVDLDMAKEDGNLARTEWAYMHTVYGPRVNGSDLFDEMMFKSGSRDQESLDTYTVRTGSGGLHLYYWWPLSWPKISQASPVKGLVDVRGNGGQYGGYVLGEGSQTAAGAYGNCRPGYEIELTPKWIRELVVEKPQQRAVRRPGAIRQPSPVSWSGLVDSVLHAGEGNRNNALLWAARTMCEEGASEEETLDTLGPAAGDAGLGWTEIERTVQSAFRVQQQKGSYR
jgi:hypothetical protein